MRKHRDYCKRYVDRAKDLMEGVPLDEEEWDYMLTGLQGLRDGFNWTDMERHLGLPNGYFGGLQRAPDREQVLTEMFYRSQPVFASFKESDIEWV